MGRIRDQTAVPDTPEVRAARDQINVLETDAARIAGDVALLIASTHPVGGQVADGISLARNAAAGDWGGALLDVVGMAPVIGDLIKGGLRGRRLARQAAEVARRLDAAKAALTHARKLAQTRAAARQYWNQVRQRRQQVLDKFKDCRDARCAAQRDAELRRITRMPATRGRWVDANGNPAPAGSGIWQPDPGTSLHNALNRYRPPKQGVPFRDGLPDFSDFPPRGMNSPPRVEIEMSGDSAKDVAEAARRYREAGGGRTTGPGSTGTWHHTEDGVTMIYVDKDIHTAYRMPDGTANSGTPHAGGDSMTRDPAF